MRCRYHEYLVAAVSGKRIFSSEFDTLEKELMWAAQHFNAADHRERIILNDIPELAKNFAASIKR